jgi:hypothetical protein
VLIASKANKIKSNNTTGMNFCVTQIVAFDTKPHKQIRIDANKVDISTVTVMKLTFLNAGTI